MNQTRQGHHSGGARDLTRGPIASNLLLFALPVLGGNVAQSLNASINTIWIGRFLGEANLTGAVSANGILFLLIGTIFGLSMAATILVAQAVGARNEALTRRIVGTSASFFLLVAVLVAAFGWTCSEKMLLWMNTPAVAIAPGEVYLRISFLSAPFLFLFTFLMAAMRGAGDSRTPFCFLMGAVVLDIALNPLFIFGWGPVPGMGIAGSAWSGVCSQALPLAALLLYLWRKRHPLWLPREYWYLYRIDSTILRTLIVKGLPMGAQMVVISLAMIAMLTMVNQHGENVAAAFGASMQLWSYVQMPAMAIGAACSTFAAQNVGAGKWERVGGVARSGVAFNFLMTGALIALIMLTDRWALALFLPAESTQTLEIARHINHIAIGSFLFFGVSFVLSGVVRSTGAVVPPLLILVFSMWGVRVPFAKFLQPWLGQDAMWWSFVISSACSMAVSILYYRFGRWRQARILPPQQLQPPGV